MIIMIAFALFLNLSVSASDSTEDNIMKIIAPYVAENKNATITRGDCVATIMKLIGADKEISEEYANAFYDQPVFNDIGDDVNAGYIILSKFSNVSVGVQRNEYDIIHDFFPKRNVTVKECLTFMLRCLTDSKLVMWDNIMEDSIKMGLLQENELDSYIADEPLQNNQFYTLLGRMLNKNRYLYWPTEEPPAGHAKSMQVDITNSIKYIDCLDKKFQSH